MSKNNYYQILGVHQNCTEIQIKKAYRLLVQKYHPDKHKGSEQLTDKFIEVRKAYEVLKNEKLRKEYDINISYNNSNTSKNAAEKPNNHPKQENTTQKEQASSSKNPQINSFDTNKISFSIGETITFIWEVANADKVELLPFGQVDAKGFKTVKIKEAINLTVKLVGINTFNGKTVSKTLDIPCVSNKQSFEKSSKKRKLNTLDIFFALFYPILMVLVFIPITIGSFYFSSIAFNFEDKFRFWLAFIFGGFMFLILYVFIKLLIVRIINLRKGEYDF